MEKLNSTEYLALTIIADMVQKFAQLYVMNVSVTDWEKLRSVRENLEKVITDNGDRMNYDRNINSKIIKL